MTAHRMREGAPSCDGVRIADRSQFGDSRPDVRDEIRRRFANASPERVRERRHAGNERVSCEMKIAQR